MGRYLEIDKKHLQLVSLRQRESLAQASDVATPMVQHTAHRWPALDDFASGFASYQRKRPALIAFTGGHCIKLGLSRYLIDLIERGCITHLATNGAGLIHDFELALAGETSEDVARWIKIGQFGLWQETSRLNDIIHEAALRGEGLGESIGRVIEEERFP